jgi:hypothetical protein
MWQGWLEFESLDSDRPVVVGPVETTQPEREHVRYWATGLTPVFLEGALSRALNPRVENVEAPELPASDAPAARAPTELSRDSAPTAILDPFEIGRRNLDILRQGLTALNRSRLLNIIAVYDLNPAGQDIEWMSDVQLGQFIVTATEAQLRMRA